MNNKVLFVITMVEEDFYNLRNIKEEIKREFPGYFSQVENLEIHERPAELNSLTVSPMRFGNVSGHWLAANISTPSKVIDNPLTLEILKQELSADDYTHICFSAFLDGYEHYKKCMEYLIEHHPHIKRVLGNVGVFYPQYTQYVDPELICLGDGVCFLRRLLGEPIDQAYTIPPTTGHIELLGDQGSSIQTGVLTTAIGCPHDCDFCATSALYNRKYSNCGISAEDVCNAIKGMEAKIGSNEFLIFIAEPNAFINKNLWYEVFDRFRNEKGSYGLVAPVSLDVLSSYDLERLQNSAIRLDIANMGLESIDSKSYSKLQNNDVKQLLKHFESYGISIWGTFIIGFPGQTREVIDSEVNGFIELDPTIPALLNLRPIRGTKLHTELEAIGCIPDDYLNVGYRFGFMTYKHDSIGKEFSDLPKMMLETYDYIESRTGHPFLKMLEVKLFQRHLTNLREAGFVRLLFGSYSKIHADWTEHFCHTDQLKQSYSERFARVAARFNEIYPTQK